MSKFQLYYTCTRKKIHIFSDLIVQSVTLANVPDIIATCKRICISHLFKRIEK